MQNPSRKKRQRHVIKPADVRRTELMDAGAKLFVANGVEKTTIDHIVAEAGASKGAFYHYFKSKHELVAALRERFTSGFREAVQSAIDQVPADDWNEKLYAYTDSAVRSYLGDFELHDVVSHQYGHHVRNPPELDAILDLLIKFIQAGCAEGAWRVDNPRLAAIMIHQGFHGAVDDFIVSKQDNPDELIPELALFFSRILNATDFVTC